MSARQHENNKFSQLFSRIEAVRLKLDVTWDKLAEMMSVNRSLFFQVKRGNCGFSPRNLFKLVELEKSAGLNLTSSTPKQEDPKPRLNAGPYYGMDRRAPIIALASAGELHNWEDMGYDVPHIPTLCKDENCYAIQITGNSMEPVYHDGDIAIVAPNTQAQQGDLVIAKTMNEEPVFKQLRFSTDMKTVRLFSFNPEYPVMDLKPSQVRFLHPVWSVTRYFKGRP